VVAPSGCRPRPDKWRSTGVALGRPRRQSRARSLPSSSHGGSTRPLPGFSRRSRQPSLFRRANWKCCRSWLRANRTARSRDGSSLARRPRPFTLPTSKPSSVRRAESRLRSSRPSSASSARTWLRRRSPSRSNDVRARSSARLRAWPASTLPTPPTSSAANRSSRRWWQDWPAPRSSVSSGRRGVASRRSSEPVSCLPSPTGCYQAAAGGPPPCSVRAPRLPPNSGTA
jgi:hypothetical protein